jgi:hypothetical protein
MDIESFRFYNNSSHDVYAYLGEAPRKSGGSLYPDTMVMEVNAGILFESGAKRTYSYRKNPSTDTLCFFIFDADTINQYSWDEIKSGYKILQRYDLVVTDEAMHKLKFIITYPPTEEMKYINMFPPYQIDK